MASGRYMYFFEKIHTSCKVDHLHYATLYSPLMKFFFDLPTMLIAEVKSNLTWYLTCNLKRYQDVIWRNHIHSWRRYQFTLTFKNEKKKKKKKITVPKQLVLPVVPVCEWCRLTSDLDPTPVGSHMVPSGPHVNESNFTFSDNLTTWPQMTFDLGMWPLTI